MDNAIQDFLADDSFWQMGDEGALEASFTLPSFMAAIAFITAVAEVAEAAEHHPEFTSVYNNVSFKLCTHEAGNTVTEKDLVMAKEISILAKKYLEK